MDRFPHYIYVYLFLLIRFIFRFSVAILVDFELLISITIWNELEADGHPKITERQCLYFIASGELSSGYEEDRRFDSDYQHTNNGSRDNIEL